MVGSLIPYLGTPHTIRCMITPKTNSRSVPTRDFDHCVLADRRLVNELFLLSPLRLTYLIQLKIQHHRPMTRLFAVRIFPQN